MKLLHLFFAASIATHALAQTQFTDPANLRGERVKPRDGRELPIDQGASGLQQLLRKLNTRASILNIVAHPDDEDGGMMAFYSRGLGARVADLSLTRGEGGQNAMTGDFEDALGLLRTQELLSSDRFSAVDQFFGTEVDFGFSKTKEEAFGKWTHERVLYDAVRAVRLYRPLVITSTWIGGVTDGHGQHQVSGEIAQEVFNAAGDPKVFPDMIAEGILPWQPLKVYARVPTQSVSDKGLYDYATGQYTVPRFVNYVSGEVSTTVPSVDVVVHEGSPDLLLTEQSGGVGSSATALTYFQFARLGLMQQKSQIPAGFRMPPPGVVDVSYHLYGSKLKNQPKNETSFFDGIDTSIEGIAQLTRSPPEFLSTGLASINKNIDLAFKKYDLKDQGSVTKPLAEALQQTFALLLRLREMPLASPVEQQNVLHELNVKSVQLNDALASSLGLHLSVAAPATKIAINSSVDSRFHVAEDSPASLAYGAISSTNSAGLGVVEEGTGPKSNNTSLTKLHPLDGLCGLTPALAAEPSRPYFNRINIEQAFYSLSKPELRNAPATPPALICSVELFYREIPITFPLKSMRGIPIQLAAIATHEGQPLRFVPLGSVSILAHAQIIPNSQKSLLITLDVDPPKIRVEGELPDNWKVTPDIQPKQSPPGFSQLRLEPPDRRSVTTLSAIAMLPHNLEVREGYRPIGYGDLPRTNYFTPATDRIVPVDLNLPTKRRIAYLPGTGDAVPGALASVGLTPTMLTVADLTPSKLANFDTVVLGVRTYAAHPDLHGAPTQALLDYAKTGGNVVVQYQTAEFTAADAPYPLTVGRYGGTVVDETAPVKLLLPAQPGTPPGGIVKDTPSTTPTMEYALLNTPNVITSADFDGWVSERGHGFLSAWDAHYAALTETHDPGSVAEGVLPQDPQRGGLITTPLGKGRWTYCAFALYRQLPEAVPGAFRLFANLLNP